MKIVFLDIDGVMNHRNYMVRSRMHNLQEFCPVAVRNLREIIKKTGAKIVVSSTWRKGGWMELKRIMSCYDLDTYLFGMTPVFEEQIRGNEIEYYIHRYQIHHKDDPIESFVILDDDKDMGDLLIYLIHCKEYIGLTDERREEAILRLNANQSYWEPDERQ